MKQPSIDELLKFAPSKYALAVLTAKRARQLVKGDAPLIDVDASKPVSIALCEIGAGKIPYHFTANQEG